MKKISFSLGFACYALYALAIWLCDAADLACYMAGLAQGTLISRAAVLALTAGAALWMKRCGVLRKGKKIDPLFVFACLCILLFAADKAVRPDFSADVKNYHILSQLPGFRSALTDDFMPGDFQMFGFRWPDRLFYPFRHLLGYRMGTLFTAVCTMLVYAQAREILTLVFGRRLEGVRGDCPRAVRWVFSESLLAFLIVVCSETVIQLGSYMIDIVGIPFALEALRTLLDSAGKEQSARQMRWYALLCGCYFAVKMTHVVYIAPLILCYLALHWKDLSVSRFLSALLAALVPVSVYLIYAFYETGNPVFPYFNSLFQSPYFIDGDFKDTRWGPSSALELALWPLISAINPGYRLSEIYTCYPAATAVLTLGLFAQGVRLLVRKRSRTPHAVLLTVTALSSAYLWSATTGHSRYFMLGYMLLGVVCADGLLALMETKRKAAYALAAGGMVVLLLAPGVVMQSVETGREFAWRDRRDRFFAERNMEYAFRDQTALAESDASPEVDLFLLHRATASLARTLYPDAPIIFHSYLIGGRFRDEALLRQRTAQIGDALDTQRVYDVFTAANLDWKDYIGLLNE